MNALNALFVRELEIAMRAGGSAVMGVLFFLIVVTLVPFAIAAVAFQDRILRWTGYIALAATPAIWVGKTFGPSTYAYFQTVCLISFIAVVAALHVATIVRQPHNGSAVS